MTSQWSWPLTFWKCHQFIILSFYYFFSSTEPQRKPIKKCSSRGGTLCGPSILWTAATVASTAHVAGSLPIFLIYSFKRTGICIENRQVLCSLSECFILENRCEDTLVSVSYGGATLLIATTMLQKINGRLTSSSSSPWQTSLIWVKIMTTPPPPVYHWHPTIWETLPYRRVADPHVLTAHLDKALKTKTQHTRVTSGKAG